VDSALIERKRIRGGQLKVLETNQIEDIHYASLDILAHTGVQIMSEGVLKLLDESGADVNFGKQLARIPPHLCEEAIRKTPSRFTLHNRNPKIKYPFEPNGNVYFAMAGLPPMIFDLEGQRRQATFEDAANFVRLGDALPYIHIPYNCVEGTVEQMTMPNNVAMAHRFLIRLKNTDKPGISVDIYIGRAEDNIRLQAAVMGGIKELRRKPMAFHWVNTVSPLTQSRELIENAVVYAKQGLPILIAPEVMGGASGPITLAGILAQQGAEFLSAAVIAQMAATPKRRPPLVYGSVSGIVDMHTGVLALGAAETRLINVASAQMAQFYGIPSRGTGGPTEAIIPDYQAGVESGIGVLMSAMAGHTMIVNTAGALEPAVLAVGVGKVVMDHDMLGMVARILEGIEVTDEAIAVDVINEIGPMGNFLFSEHTRKHFKKETYLPEVFNRDLMEGWKKKGSRSVREVARERAKQILKDHEPAPLDKDTEQAIVEIIRDIETRDLKT